MVDHADRDARRGSSPWRAPAVTLGPSVLLVLYAIVVTLATVAAGQYHLSRTVQAQERLEAMERPQIKGRLRKRDQSDDIDIRRSGEDRARLTGSDFLVLVLLVDGAFGLLLVLLPDLRSTFSGGSVHIRPLDG